MDRSTVIALLWGALGIWALATSGSLVFGVGGLVLAVGFAVFAARLRRRSRKSTLESDRRRDIA